MEEIQAVVTRINERVTAIEAQMANLMGIRAELDGIIERIRMLEANYLIAAQKLEEFEARGTGRDGGWWTRG